MEIRPQAMAIPAETDHLDKGKYPADLIPRHGLLRLLDPGQDHSRTRIRFS